MKKKLSFIIMILVLLLSCSAEKEMTVRLEDGLTIYNGVEKREYNISEGKEGELKISSIKESGKIGLKVASLSDSSYVPYEGSNLPECFVVRLEKSGKYKVTINCKNYKGTYNLEFSEL